jgi:hypothetical protein
VGKTNTIIELNGKRYDALTGALLSPAKPSHHPTIHHTASSKHHSGKTVDGIVRRTAKPQPSAAAKVATTPAAAPAAPKTAPKAAPVMDIKRNVHHAAHRKTDRSHTLMRTAVKKPAPSLRRTVKAHAPRSDVLAKVPEHHVAAKLSVRHVDARRLKRAERIAKNKLVSRFGHVEMPKTVHHGAKPHAASSSLPVIQGLSFASDQINVEPVFAATAQAANNAAHASMDIFEQALLRASSHKESYVSPKHAKKAAKKPRRSFAKRLASTSAGVVAVVALLGFFAYQNTANITMRIASSKAGFAATLPEHRPSGFSAGAFAYHSGYVAVNFKSNSDNRAFTITEKVSNWNSQTLLSEYVASNVGKDYHKLESGGRTIYTYGNNNATWVDKGIWYDVQSGGNLSTSQLLGIATSM